MIRKITTSQLEEIKQAKADGMSTKELAELYGVSVTAINKRLRDVKKKTEPAGKSCPKCHRAAFRKSTFTVPIVRRT